MQTAPRKAQRNTRQRALVMEIVRGSTAHPTATAVYEEARKRLPRISLGTVYRILRVLQEEGRVQDVAEARASARFDARTDRHPHLICLGCGRIADFDLDLPPALAEPARADGFEVVDYRLDFYGYCRDCKGSPPFRPAPAGTPQSSE